MYCINLVILTEILALIVIAALPDTELIVGIFFIPIAIYGIFLSYFEIYG